MFSYLVLLSGVPFPRISHNFVPGSRCSRSAARLASALRLTFSFCRMWLTWLFTVGSRMFRISPISALLLSAHSSRSTCSSVAVSVSVCSSGGAKKSG